MTTPDRHQSDVREIGTAAFRDAPTPRRLTCSRCEWFVYDDAQRLASHIAAAHGVAAPLSPALRKFAEEAAKGHGLSTAAARARRLA